MYTGKENIKFFQIPDSNAQQITPHVIRSHTHTHARTHARTHTTQQTSPHNHTQPHNTHTHTHTHTHHIHTTHTFSLLPSGTCLCKQQDLKTVSQACHT